jgi:hypothetical protein
MNDRQGGDPGKLAGALVQLASQQEPPSRFVAGADAIAVSSRRRISTARPCRHQRWPADALDRTCAFQFLDWLPGQPKARMTSASAATAPSITVSLMLP